MLACFTLNGFRQSEDWHNGGSGVICSIHIKRTKMQSGDNVGKNINQL